MIEIKNTYARHAMFWMWLMPLIAVLTMPLVINSANFYIEPNEVKMFSEYLGQDSEKIKKQADQIFTSAFVTPGIYKAVNDFLAPSRSEFGRKARGHEDISENYSQSLWLLLYRAIWRMCGIWSIALALLVCIGLPALVDGLMVRARKSFNFELHNPVYFWSAGHTVVLIMGLAMFLPFLPFQLSLPLLLGSIFLLCVGIWVTAANFQTGL